MVDAPAGREDPQPEIEVFRAAERLVEKIDPLNRVAPDYRADEDMALLVQHAPERRLSLRRADVRERASGVRMIADDPGVRRQDSEGRIRLHRRYLDSKVVRLPRIIAVEQGDVLSLRGTDGHVAGRGDAAILLHEVMDAVADRRQRGLKRRRVARAVVDDEDLVARVGLGED